MPKVRGRSLRVLFDPESIAARNLTLAGEIAKAGYDNLLVVSILKGSFVFAADLIRALHGAGLAPEVEFLSLSSYKTGTTSTGKVKLVRDVESDVSGRDVLIIDDILESGRTIAFAKNLMTKRGAKRVAVAVLLEKPGKLAQPLKAEHVGFVVPICSSSATAWTSPTPSASCRSSAWSRTSRSEPLEQALEVVALEFGTHGLAETLADRVEDLAGALGIDLVGNLDGRAEVGAGGTLRPAERIAVGHIVVAAAQAIAAAAVVAVGKLLSHPLRPLA